MRMMRSTALPGVISGLAALTLAFLLADSLSGAPKKHKDEDEDVSQTLPLLRNCPHLLWETRGA